MSVLSKRICSVAEFVQEISMLRDLWFPDEPLIPWCRGQERAEWELVPKLYRGTAEHYLNTENEIREEFATRAPVLSDYVKLSENGVLHDWESYFVMQHYGAPTRLLDWTESSLVALYFSVRVNAGHFPAAVWALDPWSLNGKVIRTKEVIPPSDPGITRKDRKKISPWLPKRFEKENGRSLPKSPVAVFPTHTIRRISAQRSCFTVHGSDRDGFKTISKGAKPLPLVKFEIPSWEILQIRRTLDTCGIDETAIFPDLGALGRSVAENWLSTPEVVPHKGVSTRIQQSKNGVGVFAITKIGKETKLFGSDDIGMTWVPKDRIKSLPTKIKRLYTDFGVLKDGRYGCPPNFNQLTPAWYLNHSSETPNVRCDENFDFYTLRDIKVGEELTADYSEYSYNESDA